MSTTHYRLRILGYEVLSLAVLSPEPAPAGETMDWVSSHAGQFEIGFTAPYEPATASIEA